MKKSMIMLYVFLLPMMLLSGCATLFKSASAPEIMMASTPENAKVYVNGNYIGNTPVKLALTPDKTYDVRFEKSGFAPIHRQIGKAIGAKWVILDVLGGGIPLIVDAITGKWYEIDQSEINVSMHKQQTKNP